jgi:5'-phosphate synthase pdxT subunit
MKIGVLALQGGFQEHQKKIQNLGVETVQVRLPEDLEGLNGLIIPGGESTTIGKLAVTYNLMDPLRAFGNTHAIWGSCAGAIFLSKDVQRDQPLLKLMDIVLERNAFGGQVESFETELVIENVEKGWEGTKGFHGIFIRAPIIQSVGKGVSVIAKLPDARIVGAQQGKLLATSFHPELTEDDRFHRYFLHLVDNQ